MVKVGVTGGDVCVFVEVGELGVACPHAAAMITAATFKIEIFFNPAIFNLQSCNQSLDRRSTNLK
jgi:hypothetical protein